MNQSDRQIAEYWKRRATRTQDTADQRRAERLASGQRLESAAVTKADVRSFLVALPSCQSSEELMP